LGPQSVVHLRSKKLLWMRRLHPKARQIRTGNAAPKMLRRTVFPANALAATKR
jgi:hypothetical protein